MQQHLIIQPINEKRKNKQATTIPIITDVLIALCFSGKSKCNLYYFKIAKQFPWCSEFFRGTNSKGSDTSRDCWGIQDVLLYRNLIKSRCWYCWVRVNFCIKYRITRYFNEIRKKLDLNFSFLGFKVWAHVPVYRYENPAGYVVGKGKLNLIIKNDKNLR